ncbi:MAG: TIGR01777 family oxidoreductase [Lentimicrobiaceae bacterium]|nr:TIGR01777 family oxidoreductase [Lentimicrobiaceae bacterium]
MNGKSMVICGAGGFIGSHLRRYFEEKGYQVIPVGRRELTLGTDLLAERMEGADIIINLAGESIIRRWTPANKRKIYSSRIDTTRMLAGAVRAMKQPPIAFLNASAIGIYADQGEHDETSQSYASDFLAEVCLDWEKEASTLDVLTRVIFLRFGIVLDSGQGALAKLLPLFRMGLGGRLGSGRQAFAWIHIQDLLRAVEFLLQSPEIKGPVNFTAPEVSDNRTFTNQLARVLKRPALIPVPSFALRLIFGKGADSLLKGQHAFPATLQQAGFSFLYPTLQLALEAIIKKKKTLSHL